MSNILIIGAGSMGTAFSFPCSDRNHNVTILGTKLENDFIEDKVTYVIVANSSFEGYLEEFILFSVLYWELQLQFIVGIYALDLIQWKNRYLILEYKNQLGYYGTQLWYF